MNSNSEKRRKAFGIYRNEQLHLKISSLGMLFFFAVFFLPDAFGIMLGTLINSQRVMTVVMLLVIFGRKIRRQRMISLLLGHKNLLFFAVFLFVCFYTMVFRVNIGALFNPLVDMILAYFLTIYLLRYEISQEKLLRLLLLVGTVLCLLGIAEMVTEKNLFSYIAFQKGMFSGGGYRNESYRIAVNGQHPLGYGLFLLLLYPISCCDFAKSKMDVLCRPVLGILILINVYATGSRSTLGLLLLEFVIVLLLSRRKELVKAMVLIGPLLAIAVLLAVLLSETGPVRSVLIQMFSTIDAALGTNLTRDIMNFQSVYMMNSTSYRSTLLKVFQIKWLNPVVGRGLAFRFSAYIDDVAVKSIDNYYVLLYIQYAYPGLVSFLCLCVSQIRYALKGVFRHRDYLCSALLVAFTGYFINLWFVDTLGTMKYVFVLFGLLYVRMNGGGK